MTSGLRFDVNCSILFTELPLLERPAAVRAAGFRGVEFWWPFAEPVPASPDVDAFVSAVTGADVDLVGLNLFGGDMAAGERGVLSHPGREREFRDNVDVVVAIAEATGCRVVNGLYGNRLDDLRPAHQDEVAVANLDHAARALARVGATVVVEPLSGVPTYPLRTAADALAVVGEARSRGVDDVRVLADLYHLAVNGDDVDRVVTEHVADIGHVQVADAPGRHEPGTGALDVDAHLDRLAGAGYAGWVGLEYVPSGPSAKSFDWLPWERRGEGVA